MLWETVQPVELSLDKVLSLGDLYNAIRVLEQFANQPTDRFDEPPPAYAPRSASTTPLIGAGDFDPGEELDEQERELIILLCAQTERARRVTRDEYVAALPAAERRRMEESMERFLREKAEKEALERQKEEDAQRRAAFERDNQRSTYFGEFGFSYDEPVSTKSSRVEKRTYLSSPPWQPPPAWLPTFTLETPHLRRSTRVAVAKANEKIRALAPVRRKRIK